MILILIIAITNSIYLEIRLMNFLYNLDLLNNNYNLINLLNKDNNLYSRNGSLYLWDIKL